MSISSRDSHWSQVSRCLFSTLMWPCPAPHHSKHSWLLFSSISIYLPGWGALRSVLTWKTECQPLRIGPWVVQVHLLQIPATRRTRPHAHRVGVHVVCVFATEHQARSANGIRGLRAKYWSHHKSWLDTGENRWSKGSQWCAFAHLCAFLSLHGATGRSEDPGASYWIDCLRSSTEGIYIIPRYMFSTNRLSSASVVLLVLIRGGQPSHMHVHLHACLAGKQAQHHSWLDLATQSPY